MTDVSTAVRGAPAGETQLDRVLTKLDRIEDRIGDMREALADLRATLNNVKAMVDVVYARAADLELRVEVLEQDRAARDGAVRRGALVSSGSAMAGGGFVVGLIELVRRLIE